MKKSQAINCLVKLDESVDSVGGVQVSDFEG